MSKSARIQFRKGVTFPEFMQRFGTEDKCKQALHRIRWPKGFVCPNCSCTKGHTLRNRPLVQCASCRRQTSLTAGTIFHSTKLPLQTWFLAIYFLSQTKTRMSSLELSRHLNVNHNTAWLMMHKLMEAAATREAGRMLTNVIEVDDAYMGGRCPGKTVGRGSPNKVPFVIAVDRSKNNIVRHLVLSVLPNFRMLTITVWAKQHLSCDAFVFSDGLSGFAGINEVAPMYAPIAVKGRKRVLDLVFPWTSTLLGNLKTSLTGVRHRADGRYLYRYFGMFQFRFNRRYNLKGLFYSLLNSAVNCLATPLNTIRMAEYAR